MRRGQALTVCVVLALGAAAAAPAAGSSMPSEVAATALVRVDQVGYTGSGSQIAYALATRDVEDETFWVLDGRGQKVLTGRAGPSTGRWNDRYPFVSPLDLSGLTAPGSYTVRLENPSAASPPFRVASSADLYAPLLANSRAFFQAQRDGPDVIAGPLDREPAHLNDASATVYAPPRYRDFSLVGDLDPVSGGPVDVAGGWFDAGDYLKFLETTSYADTLLLLARRDAPELVGPSSGADLTAEVRFGTDWLLQMWDEDSRTLLYQVGIGDGNGCGSICGDHDLWRLPEVDDTYHPTQRKWRYLRERPAFRAEAPGAELSPNLAGRTAAALALCSQVFRACDPTYADRCLTAARHIYDQADTTDPRPLLTTAPHGYYPETSWRDDLELGATQLAIALSDPGAAPGLGPDDGKAADYLQMASEWADATLRDESGDTLNLYDVSGLAHAELHRAIDLAGDPAGLAVTQGELRAGIRDQVATGVRQATRDPFGVGVRYGFDVASHVFGLVVLAEEYDSLTGGSTYADFARSQLGAVFGANAWGASFVVGAGRAYPQCMQHQVANLSGSLDGSARLALGAVVNGPNRPRQFRGLGLPDDANACPPGGGDPYRQFTGHGGRYVDAVTSWPSVEPAIDFTATSVLALTHAAQGFTLRN